jgi:hypothetical protein
MITVDFLDHERASTSKFQVQAMYILYIAAVGCDGMVHDSP